MSERRACRVIDADRQSMRSRSTLGDDTVLREKLRGLVNQGRRFGHRRLHILLRREGVMIVSDNWTEITSNAVLAWRGQRGVK